jgi:hypothetical protein
MARTRNGNTPGKAGRGERAEGSTLMQSVIRLMVMAAAAMAGKAFRADPNYIPTQHRPTRFKRHRDDIERLTHHAPPETAKAVTGLES